MIYLVLARINIFFGAKEKHFIKEGVSALGNLVHKKKSTHTDLDDTGRVIDEPLSTDSELDEDSEEE